MTGTWGAPNLPSGRDQFTGRQQPDPRPVDDLSRFVLDRIRFAENGPKLDVPQVYNQPAGPIAHRYAAEMRADMVAFRRIVALYVEHHNDVETSGVIADVMLAIANRFSEHPDFQDDWKR